MRILVVHPRMAIKGGGERVAIHTMQAGVNAGYTVSLVSEDFDTKAFEDFFGCNGLFDKVERITYPPFKPLFRNGLLLYQRLGYHQIRVQRALSKRTDLDVLLGTQDIGYTPNVALPVIQYCYFPEYFAHLEENPGSPVWSLYYRPASMFYRDRVQRVSRFLAVSDYTRDFITRKWRRYSETIYPPCPVGLYSSFTGPKENTVITVGRVVPEKRMHLFVDIARALPAFRFIIVGSIGGPTSDYYESLTRHAPKNLSFVLSPLRKEKELLEKSKVYVHCARNEHFGITVVEAMAAGCVPVVHDSGGPREIVDAGVGFRWRELREAVGHISRLMEDDDLRERLSATASKKAAEYSPEIFEEKLARIFKKYES